MKRLYIFIACMAAAIVISGCKSTYTPVDIKNMVIKNMTFPITDNKLISALKINTISSVRLSQKDNKIYFDFSADLRALMTSFSCAHFIYSCEPTLENNEPYFRNFKLESTECNTPLPKEIETIVADVLFKSFNDMKFRTLCNIPDKVDKFYINSENELVLE